MPGGRARSLCGASRPDVRVVRPVLHRAGRDYVQTGADGLCEFCQYATGEEFGRQFSVYYSHIWRGFGIVCGFIVFNYAVVYLATFLRFKGKNPLGVLLVKLKRRKVN
ncbi:hypothetical protein DL765_002723 [Monosporascus sp. GIB2]|nr:hypothetical protein DL765_002723 [Monosporascus sp. GIB2]